MSSEYLLSCSCGKQNRVSPSQAGGQFVCACGEKVEVPTLGQIKKLPPANLEKPTETQSVWGPVQGLLFCGTIVLATGLTMLAIFYLDRPTPFELDEQFVQAATQQHSQDLSLTQSWIAWINLRDKGLGEGVMLGVVDYENARKQFQQKTWVAGAILVAGLLLLVAAGVLKSAQNAPRTTESK